MKYFFAALLGSLFFSASAGAQTLTPSELLSRGEIDHEIGFIPESLESLVGSASIIIKGRFIDHLGIEDFFGYGDNRESFKERLGIDDETTDRLAIPKSDYSVAVDEVFLGDSADLANGSRIVYRIFEFDTADRSFTDPSVERLLFLNKNPDGTYSPLGPASVLRIETDEYLYDSLTQFPGDFRNRILDFAAGYNAREFEENVKAEIQKQYPTKN